MTNFRAAASVEIGGINVDDSGAARAIGMVATPQVVLVEGRLAVEVSTGPGCQPTGGGDPDVPAGEEGAESDSITPEHADIDVAVVAPRPAEMELERMTAADPPPEWRGAEQVRGRRDRR